MTQARRTGPALETMYRFLLWRVPAVEKYSRGPYPLLIALSSKRPLDLCRCSILCRPQMPPSEVCRSDQRSVIRHPLIILPANN